MVAAAKALSKVARDTKVLAIRGGVLQGKPITDADVENLAKLPPLEVLQAQLVGALAAPMATIVGLFTAPLRDLVSVIDQRIEQLGGSAQAESPSEGPAEPEGEAEPTTETEDTPSAQAEPAGEDTPEE
jgi:large subunit ribosomal protein L10